MAVNVTHEIKANKLIITIDISARACQEAEPSMSGKTMIVASTKGSEKIQGPPGWDLSYSINVMGKEKPPR